MTKAPAKKNRFLDFALIIAISFLLSQAVIRFFFTDPPQADPAKPVSVQMQDASVRYGANPMVIVKNDGTAPLRIPSHCPQPPFKVFSVAEDGLKPVEMSGEPYDCKDTPEIAAGGMEKVDLGPWKYALFGNTGLYELQLQPQRVAGSGAAVTGSGADMLSVRFSVNEPNGIVKLFRAIIMKPMLNALVLIGSWLPGHSLAWSIVILTLIVKLLLFYPTQRALEGQKKMQLLQPKLEEVRKKYASDPARQQQEVMKLWKEHNINPMQSCLPLLLQFPVLIGLFYVVQDGVVIEGAKHLLYPFQQDIGWSFHTQLLGLDLTVPNLWLFPPLLVALQFLQMKLSFAIADKKKAKQIEAIEHGGVKTTEKSAQEIQQKVMLYALPLLIGFFALKFPGAVSLYWGISTLFGIGQQMVVNREHLKA